MSVGDLKHHDVVGSHSPGKWKAQREKVTVLYSEHDLPLKEVMRIMEAEHNFRATKRMYDTRLKQWNVSKNYKAKDKEKLAAQIFQHRTLDNITFNNKPVKVDRVLRHCKNVRRLKRRQAGEAEDKREAAECDSVEPSKQPPVSPLTKGCRLDFDKHQLSMFLDQNCRTNHCQDHNQIPHGWGNLLPLTITTPNDILNIELILQQIKTYHELQLISIETRTPTTEPGLSADHILWTNIKSAIYFLKKGSDKLAWPLLNEACQQLPHVMNNTSLSFLLELFSTLSPTNTKYHTEIRMSLLRYVKSVACVKYGPKHPLVTIAHELILDTGDGGSSHVALPLISELTRKHSGSTGLDSIQVQRAYINLLRRDYQLADAETCAKRLLETCEQNLGHDNTYTCSALTDLIHVVSDKADYRYAMALTESLLERYQSAQGASFPDDKAAYVFEILAELYQFQKDKDGSIEWLRRGLEAAYKARGGIASTMHVKNKLKALYTENHELGRALQLDLMYPAEDFSRA